MSEAALVPMPMTVNNQLTLDDGDKLENPTKYPSLVGALQ